MKKEDKNTYSFRDSNNLLINLEKGTVSEFIRDSIDLRLNIDDKTYIEEQATLRELIKFYEETIIAYKYVVQATDKLVKKVLKAENDATIKLEKLKKEDQNIKNLLDKKREVQDKDLNTKRKQSFETLINNILSNKDNPTIPILNIEYLQKNCEYQTKTEFKNALYKHIQEQASKIYYNNRRITQEDIVYIINKVKVI